MSSLFENSDLTRYFSAVITPAIFETLKMVIISGILSIFFGLIFGVILYLTEEDGLAPNKTINRVLSIMTDVVRAFPTLVLIVALTPLTRAWIGTTVGTNAAIFALTIGCTPFATRMTVNSLNTVSPQLIKSALGFGATKFQIVFRIVIIEALPVLMANYTIMLINLLSMTTVAGAVGAGGLGAVALTYGYQRFDYGIMYFVVFILILLVLAIQGLGTLLYKHTK